MLQVWQGGVTGFPRNNVSSVTLMQCFKINRTKTHAVYTVGKISIQHNTVFADIKFLSSVGKNPSNKLRKYVMTQKKRIEHIQKGG